jgi:hypothetical protein
MDLTWIKNTIMIPSKFSHILKEIITQKKEKRKTNGYNDPIKK